MFSEASDDNFEPLYKLEHIYNINQSPFPIPNVEVDLMLSKYDNHIKLIVYMDAGAHKTIMNPFILPEDQWTTHKEYFKAADDKIFKVNMISKKEDKD